MLKANNLTAGYESLQVLFDVSVHVDLREVVVMIGPNGSGKSTLLKSLLGLTRIFSGTVALNGTDLTHMPPHQIAKCGVTYLPQLENVFEPLSVKENLQMAGYINYRNLDEKIAESIEMFPMLKEVLGKKTATMSGGERQMLAMAMAVVRESKYICFDEPTANLAPRMAKQVLDKITELRDSMQVGVMMVEQNAKKALEISDRAYLLVGGKIAFDGESSQLLSRPDLGRLYLGITIGAQ